MVFSVDPLPAGVEERSAKAVLSAQGQIFDVPYTVTAEITIRQSESGSTIPDTNVAAIRALLKAMNPTQDKAAVTSELAAMTITGVVVSEASGVNLGNANNIAVQDDNSAKDSGLTLNCSQFANMGLSAGKVVSIPLTDAQVATYGGVIQLYLSNNATVSTVAETEAPAPVVVTPAQLLDYESMLVQIDNCYPTTGYGEAWNSTSNKGNANFATAAGETFVVRTGSSASFKNELIPEKSGSMIGIAGQFNGTLQLSPRTAADIKLTEPIPAPEYAKTTIAALQAGNYEIENATIVGVHQEAVMFAQDNDGTVNYVLAFNNKWTTQTSNPYLNDVGKTASIKGSSSLRYGLYQFGDFEITVGETSTLQLPAPAAFDAAAIAEYTSAIAADVNKAAYKYVSMTGTLEIIVGPNYNTYNLAVAGCPTKIQFAYGLNSYFDGLTSGDVVDVTGFALGYDTSKSQMNVLLREIKKNTSTPALTFTTKPKAFAGSNPEDQTIDFTTANISDDQIVTFSFEGTDAGKFDVRSSDNTSVTIYAVGNNASDAAYTAKLVAKLGSTVLAELEVRQSVSQSITYTKITSVADLTDGTYYMSGYLENYSSGSTNKDWGVYAYHVWTGKMASKDLATVNYSYEGDKLTLDPSLDGNTVAGDITLVSTGTANTYYIKVGEKYLKSTASPAANRSLALVDTSDGAEWTFADGTGDYAGSILVSNNGVTLGTAGAASNLLRSYKASTSLKWGLVFFKAN